jgi:hypothetical protein
MRSLHEDQYFVRDSVYNLVELSLLARLYEEHCVPRASGATLNQGSLAQTLLKMKATEGQGRLKVAIYEADPVGFHWVYQGQLLASWVHPEYRALGIEKVLMES